MSSALFADGAAAMVVQQRAAPPGVNGFGRWRIVESASMLIDDSEGDMTWHIGDEGFVMTLSPRVPQIIGSTLRPWIEPLLRRHGLSTDHVRHWAIHPGGPRIVSAVGEALELDESLLQPSRDVLREHGNMSSPTVLFILNRLRRQTPLGPCVMMSFGPGLIAEAALLT